MTEKKVITYKGLVIDGWQGSSIGRDPIADLIELIESYKDTETVIKVTVEIEIKE